MVWAKESSKSARGGTYEYLEAGEMDEADFLNECKNYTKFRKVFRDAIKTDHDYCSGIGEECEYSGSPGCGEPAFITYPGGTMCACEIELTYCTEPSTSRAVRRKTKKPG